MGKFKSKAIAALKQKLKRRLVTVGFPDAHAETRKSIDPDVDRSKGNPQNFLGEEVREIDDVADSDKEPCRDCSEGMQW